MMRLMPKSMKKNILIILTPILITLVLAACSLQASFSLEGASLNGVTPGGFADGTVSVANPLMVSVNTPTILPLTLPVENFTVAVEATGGQATYDAIANQVEVTFFEAGSSEIKIICSAPGYKEATYIWPVEVTLRSQPSVLIAADSNGKIIQESITLTEGDSPVTFELQGGVEDGTLKLDTEDSHAITAALEENILTVTPKQMGHGRVKVFATAEGYHDEVLTLEVDVLGLIDLSASKSTVTLTVEDTTTITVSSKTPGMTFTATAQGNVTLTREDNKLILASEEAGSATVTIQATASGYTPRTLTIPVTIKAAPPPPVSKPTTGGSLSVNPIDTSAYDTQIAEVIRYTNEERIAAGLSPLEHFKVVNTPAMIRAQEAAEYWSHTRPDGSNFDTVFAQVGLSYQGVGENLYSSNGNPTPRQIVDAWMDSPGHRANILESRFNGIGIGVYQGSDGIYWVQLFAMR